MDPTTRLMNAGTDFAVKMCAGPYMDRSLAEIANAQNTRRSHYNAMGKIGDLEVLNSVAGPIAEGLRTMTHASNAIRTGCGSAPTMIGQVLDGGVNWVLDTMGISKPMVEILEKFHPEVANSAYGSAKQIYDQISNGKFKMSDVPGYLQEFQNLERLIRGIYTPGGTERQLTKHCDASPYAMDLLARAPKYKFLFVVQFIMEPGFTNLDKMMSDMAFVVKKTSRPKIKFANEDINYYNFRTPVLTRTEFDEMSMSFHDDSADATNTFYRECMQALIPITNNKTWTSPDILERNGMNFLIQDGKAQQGYAASLGPVSVDSKQQIFQEIRLYHVYDWGHNANVYHFYNPKITSLIPDDLDMSETNTLSELSMTFKYDYVYVESASVEELNIDQLHPNALYRLRYNGAGGAMDGPNMSSTVRPYNASGTAPASCNTMNQQNTSSVGTNNANNAFNSGFGSGFGF